MNFIRKLLSYWFILLIIGMVGYFSAYNMELIYVNIPQVGELKMKSAIVFVIIFITGAFLSSLIFGLDFLKKWQQVRTLTKRLHKLESLARNPTLDALGSGSLTKDANHDYLKDSSQSSASRIS